MIRIKKENIPSHKLARKLGAIEVGEEINETSKLMYMMMQEMGREKFESVIGKTLEEACPSIILYKLSC